MTTKEDLIKLLKEKVVTVKFKKKDESIRKMICTLSEEYLPEPEPLAEGEVKRTKKDNPQTEYKSFYGCYHPSF